MWAVSGWGRSLWELCLVKVVSHRGHVPSQAPRQASSVGGKPRLSFPMSLARPEGKAS